MARKEIQVIKYQPMNRNTYIEGLVELSYERVNMVIESGTYAVRGSIVDAFPVNQNQPIRCDYFGDDIERMSSFRVDNQKSIRDISETIIKSVDSVVVNRLSFDARVMDSELISNINEGDYVVHEKYGIGKFAGFCRLTVAGTEGEYVLIHYRGNDKLYMPLDQIPLLHKFVGSDSKPRLNGLYDGSWNKTRH